MCITKGRRNPKYKRTMQQADQFGIASKIVKEVYYRHVPKAVRKHGLFGKLTGLVNGWLYEGKSKKEVEELLIDHCQTLVQTTTSVDKTMAGTPVAEAPMSTNTSAVPTPAKPTQQSTAPAIQKPKQARYLSRWKVKPNGRLHIPGKVKVNNRNRAEGRQKRKVVLKTKRGVLQET